MILKYTLSLSSDSFSITEYPKEVNKGFNGSGLPFLVKPNITKLSLILSKQKIKNCDLSIKQIMNIPEKSILMIA